MCGRWSLNKNSVREIAMDENTRTLKTNGPFNREEKRRAQPQTLLNLWSGSNITFENILLRSFPFRNFRKWIVTNRDESFKIVLRPRWNISIDFNFIRWYIKTVIINRNKYFDKNNFLRLSNIFRSLTLREENESYQAPSVSEDSIFDHPNSTSFKKKTQIQSRIFSLSLFLFLSFNELRDYSPSQADISNK